MRGLGSDNIDHRLRVADFADGGPTGATFEMPVAQIEKAGAVRDGAGDLRSVLAALPETQGLDLGPAFDLRRPVAAAASATDRALAELDSLTPPDAPCP